MNETSSPEPMPGLRGESGTASITESMSPGEISGISSESIQESARELSDQAKRRAESMLGVQKSALVEQVSGIADALRLTATQLNSDNKITVARYANEAARGLDRISGALRTKDLNSIIAQSNSFARRQPGLLIAGSVVAGFLLARLLKSSASSVQHDEYPSPDYENFDTSTSLRQGPYAEGAEMGLPPIGG